MDDIAAGAGRGELFLPSSHEEGPAAGRG